jgi:hypothetical protein
MLGKSPECPSKTGSGASCQRHDCVVRTVSNKMQKFLLKLELFSKWLANRQNTQTKLALMLHVKGTPYCTSCSKKIVEILCTDINGFFYSSDSWAHSYTGVQKNRQTVQPNSLF